MREIKSRSVHLMITSPPYFNAPFDYKDLYATYDEYLTTLQKVAKQIYRVLQEGRIAVLNIDDMLVNGKKFPITADATKIFQKAGFRYRDRIIWKKPEGYIRISRRSGVILQNPYPMYFYPDNLLESIIIFQKGKFDYKSIPKEDKEKSRIDKRELQKNKWFLTLWEMTNVLPNATLEKDIAAVNSTRYRHKITGQQFDIQQIQSELKRLFHYKSDSLHWNLEQTDKIGELGERAINSYQNISERLNVEMHSLDRARNKIQQLSENRDEFMSTSRGLAKKAQHRESLTEQPKERVSGTKAILTIKNYLGGYYYFTADEIEIKGDEIILIEAKHTSRDGLPSENDIRDGLLKMVLFSNLKNVSIKDCIFRAKAFLKLTSSIGFNMDLLSDSKKHFISLLLKEAEANNYLVKIF